MSVVSERVKELREKKKLTQKQLANKLQISQQILSALETGKTTFTEDYIIQFAKHFNVSTDYLLGLSEAPTTDKDVQFVCDYTGFSLKTIRFLALFNKEGDFMKTTFDFIEFLIDKISNNLIISSDIIDMVENSTLLYLLYTQNTNRPGTESNPIFIDTTDPDEIKEILDHIDFKNRDLKEQAENLRTTINSIKYSLNLFSTKCIEEFALNGIENISIKEFEEAENRFYKGEKYDKTKKS